MLPKCGPQARVLDASRVRAVWRLEGVVGSRIRVTAMLGGVHSVVTSIGKRKRSACLYN